MLLELAHAIPSDVQRPDDWLDRLWVSIGDEAVAKLEHGALIYGKLNKRLVEGFSIEAQLNFFRWPWLLRRHQFRQSALFISDLLVQARNSTSCLLNLDDLLDGEAGCGGDLLRSRLDPQKVPPTEP